MKTSEQIGEIAAAMAAAQGGVKKAGKNAENPFFGKPYADLSSIADACMPALTENGIAVMQGPVVADGKVGVVTRFVHKSGQWIESELLLPATKHDPQAYGSAVTYARRYSLAAMAGVSTVDDDGNAATHEAPPAPRQQRPARPAPTPTPAPEPEPEDVSKLSDDELRMTLMPFSSAKGKALMDTSTEILQKSAALDPAKLNAASRKVQARIKEYIMRQVAKESQEAA